MKSGIIFLVVLFLCLVNIVLSQPTLVQKEPPKWAKIIDTNRNGRVEREEYRTAADAFFNKYDKNRNGILEEDELPRRPNENRPFLPPNELPQFLFLESGGKNLTRAEFNEKVNLRFNEIDANKDGTIDWGETIIFGPPDQQMRPPLVIKATFIGAEMRFGDRLVRNAPFSAETIREENRRLFDGSIIKNQSKGAIFRDSDGRIRHEQTIDFIGGFPVFGENDAPKKLINLIDVANKTTFSFGLDRKVAIKSPMLEKPPVTFSTELPEGKTESLGKKEIEGVLAEGTRTTIEIPIGQIGNDRTLYVVTEKWFSPELQMIVLFKHTDPFAGETIFRLVNIRKEEPSPELFLVPKDYIVEERPGRNRPTRP
jgi:hypothetical protein